MSERKQIQTVPIDAVDLGNRHRKDMGDLSGLMQSMDELGMLQPIGLNTENVLVFGGRRLESAKRLGWSMVPFVVIDTLAVAGAALKAERDENLFRKEMTKSEMVELGKAIEEIERPKATERLKTKQKAQPVEPVPQAENGKTRDAVGEALGVSGKHYEQAKKVVEKGTDELVEAMDKGELSVKDAAKVADLPEAKQKKVARAKNPKKAAKEAVEQAKEESKEEVPAEPAGELIGGINRLCRLLDQAKAEVKKLASDPLGMHIHSESVISQIEAARKALWQARPTEPCNCVKSGTAANSACRACFGHGVTCVGRVLKGGR